MSPQGPRKMIMKTKLVFQQGTKNAEEAINLAITELETDGWTITQIMNVTHNSAPLDDDWKVLIFGAKEQEDPIIQPVKTVVVNTGSLPPRDRN